MAAIGEAGADQADALVAHFRLCLVHLCLVRLCLVHLCLAAIPFAFGSLRSGGMGKRLFLGIVFAVGFWVLQTMFVRLAGAFRLDYRIAYAIPPFALLGISWLLFRRRSR